MFARAHQRSSGIHLLTSGRHLRSLVDAADLGPDSLVFDLGAGPGTVTVHLARTGARVIAVERNPPFIRQLERRFGGAEQRHSAEGEHRHSVDVRRYDGESRSNVRIVAADLRAVPFPGRPFQVVSSIPFDLSTLLLRRLIGVRRTNLQRADLVVEWGFAKRLLEPVPRSREIGRWRWKFDFELMGRIPASAFRPRPAVDCAHLAIIRR